MIKLTDILKQSVIKLTEGGKLFGSRSQRVTTAEMNAIFDELKNRLGSRFKKFQLSKALQRLIMVILIFLLVTIQMSRKNCLITWVHQSKTIKRMVITIVYCIAAKLVRLCT